MRQNEANLIFSATLHGPSGALCEVVVAEQDSVHYTYRADSGKSPRTEEIKVRRRDVNDFLWEVEDIAHSHWDKARYGRGEVSAPGSWMVLLEKDRKLVKWQGCGEYPPHWEEFRLLVEEFIDRPFGW